MLVSQRNCGYTAWKRARGSLHAGSCLTSSSGCLRGTSARRHTRRASTRRRFVQDIQRLKGKSSNAYPEDLKYSGSDQVLYRDNIALMSAPT